MPSTATIHAAVLAALALMSLGAFISHARDKRAARLGRRRTPERRLLAWALLGGWPGAWLAQRLLHHKTRKQPFQRWFRLAGWALGALLASVVGLVCLRAPMPPAQASRAQTPQAQSMSQQPEPTQGANKLLPTPAFIALSRSPLSCDSSQANTPASPWART